MKDEADEISKNIEKKRSAGGGAPLVLNAAAKADGVKFTLF